MLSRNELYGLGVEPSGALSPAPTIMEQTQVNLPEVHLASMSDAELARYRNLLLEPRALVPKGEPNRIGSVNR